MATALLLSGSAFAQAPAMKWYGFIRSYYTHDSHASSAGTEDLYYYMPQDNDQPGMSNFVALTTRLGVDVNGYEVSGYKIGAKIETDFYSKNGTVAVLRLRQAYATVAKDDRSWKIGQTWHPMAVDLPDIFTLESGAPFGPFSRTPQVCFEYKADELNSITAAAIWQMQYTSTGPEGATANYMKYSGIPELYVGYNRREKSSLFKIGVDLLAIKPYKAYANRLVTMNLFQYGQVTKGFWTIKEKITYAQDGSHMNMIGGYGVSGTSGVNNDDFVYSPSRTLSAWATIAYKKDKWVPSLFLGASKCFGTFDNIMIDTAGKYMYWCKNNASTLSGLIRFQPEIVYNLGKLQFGASYMMTAAHYGTPDTTMQATANLHWVTNHRLQMLVKYTF